MHGPLYNNITFKFYDRSIHFNIKTLFFLFTLHITLLKMCAVSLVCMVETTHAGTTST